MNSNTHVAALTIAQFAEALGVSRWTVHRLIATEAIRSTKIGRSRRIPSTEIERLLAEREVPLEPYVSSRRRAQ